ncbi:GTPase [Pseudomonas extremaustralis]|uniref:GTPase n=1 Tax=Pseudomonas extremaustralis TaxID=359110 RepID=A0A5C5QHI7_9PSED|nr:GTPase [Pseudomonas extremaustralis]EZI30576.1 GTPase [Pseudomonas extremaustralis 14-3 substr. 14-3b]TWS04641.1 GTPase [Pseudomonas extremaustralis]SDG31615.1 50S ribosome-binding GTPase [Pseudomonas extremaustralis]
MDQAELYIDALEVECKRLQQQHIEGASLKPRIAAWGVVKAGKSSLLNMLSGHIQQEYFATGAVRTTRINQQLELEHYVLVDTPGLGIDQSDSRQAMEGLEIADIVLFVHAPPGELDEEQVNLLLKLRDVHGDALEQRLVFVFSLLDLDQDGAMAQVRERIEGQVLRCLGFQPTCFEVSSRRYQRGVELSREGMQAKSGIPGLALHLDQMSSEMAPSLAAARQQRLVERREELSAALDQAIEQEQVQIQKLCAPYARTATAFIELMSSVQSSFSAKTAEIRTAREKLNSL